MSLSWSYDAEGQTLVVHLAGYLGAGSVDRLDGALVWVLAQHPDALVVDASGLRGWSTEGQAALADAVMLIQEHGTRISLCAADRLSPSAVRAKGARIDRDVPTALAALTPGNRPTAG